MARFGQGVNAYLGKTDYSNYLAGALQGARGVAGGGEAIGQGIANLGQQLGSGVRELMKNQKEKKLTDGTVDMIFPILEDPQARANFGIPQDATPEVIRASIRKMVKSLGAEKSYDVAIQARNEAGFSAGMDASNRQITESIASMPNLPAGLTSAQAGNFNVPSSIVQDAPPQSVEDFLRTGKISTEAPPSSFNDFMDANGITRPQAPEAVQAQETAQAPKSVVIPDDLKDKVGYKSSTGEIIPRDSFRAETSQLNKNLEKIKFNLVELRKLADANSKPTITFDPTTTLGQNPRVISRFGAMPKTTTRPLTNDEQIQISDRIEQLELERQDINKKLADQNTVEIKIAELNNPKNINKPLEEKASNIIDEAFAFAQENDLPDLKMQELELLEWKMMKDVIKEVKRDATDEEKTAAFVAAYSKIAPINASVYSKIEKIFDKTPAITDLGNGSMIVTVNGQTFLTSKTKETPASVAKMKSQNQYYDLLAASQIMGLNTAMANKDLWPVLNRLHLQYGDKDYSGMRIPLARLIGGAQSGQTPIDKSTRSNADSIIAGE